MYCTACGTKNPDNSDNCFNCGSTMGANHPPRAAGSSSGAAAKQSRTPTARTLKAPITVEIAGHAFTVSDEQIQFGRQVLRCDDVVGIRYGVYKHYTNGIRDSQSYKVWLTDGRTTMDVECAKGFFVRDATIESRYDGVLRALYPAVIVPLVQSMLTNLDNGAGFQIGDVIFDKNGLHRTSGFGAIQKGIGKTWVALFGGSSVEDREHRYQHLPWTEFGGRTLADGNISLFRGKEVWVQFALRDVWNAVCLAPLLDFLSEDGRLWSFVNS